MVFCEPRGGNVNTNRRLALGLAALIPAGLWRAGSAGATPAEARLPADGPLHRFVGAWRGDITVQSAGGEAHYTQNNRFAWTLGGRFLEERGTDTNGGAFVGIWSFAGTANSYRAHYFLAPSGDVVALSHTWDEAKLTFSGSAELPGGLRMLAEDRFLGRDSYVWTITVQDSKGVTLARTHGKERRVRS
jgi:hypothetical protein